MPPQYKSLPTEEPKSPLPPPSLRLSIARNYSRRVFALIAIAILLFGSICHVLKKTYDNRHHRKATPSNLINPPRLSDMNEHFFGYGVDHDDGSLPADLQSGLDSNNLAQNLGLKEEDSVDLMLSDDDAGIDFWSVETEKVFADPPKRLDGTSPNPNTPPGNMLIRPVPARFPHPPDPKHPNVCLGPPKYEWNGPDEFVVDSNQFDRLYMLSRSPYIRARFRIREGGNEDKDTDNILIRPNIRLGEAEINNILEVSQLRNTTRKSYILRLATPSWEESGNGRFNCIFADIDVILSKSLRSLSLLGAGAVNGGVWFGKLPPITTLVGWAGQGHVRLESAPNVDKAIVAVKNGVIDANRIKARTAVKMKIVNGPIKVGILPLVEKSTDGNSDDEGLSIRLRSVNGAVNARVDESFHGTFVAGTVNGIVKVTGERLNFDRNGHRFASGTHGDVSSPQTMSIEAHAVNGPVFITFEELFL